MKIKSNIFCLILIIAYFIFSSILYAKKILLTGGAGFIGSHVAQKLLERGDTLIIVDNMNNAYDLRIKEYNLSLVAASDFNDRLSVYAIDICNRDAIEQLCESEKIDVICHLAARAGVRASIDDPQEYFRTNNIGTLILCEAARKHGIKHIVLASSSSVYGVREDGPFYENDSVDRQSSPYGATKRSGELLAYVYYYLYGISITNLRFFTVYGPRGRTDMAPFIFMDAIYNNRIIKVYGDGSAIRDFTYIDDIVYGILKAIDTPLGYEIVNIGRGEPIILSDFIVAMENIMREKAHINYVDVFSGDVPKTHAGIEKARQLFDYIPKVSVQQGLEHMYNWYKNEYLLLVGPTKKNGSDVEVLACDY
ncbi:MAG TPA: NAD-dependent epimerase/dehydratase family protein [Candidatus Babeliales bacterium]|nr:NAD-dependent epimerase/dehydratase family protein [Candidatus Babeliales bacterium]